MSKPKIIVIGDIHFPFHHKKSLRKVLDVIKSEKPDYVVQIGDLYDQYAFSKYTKAMWIDPKKELVTARELAEEMWNEVKKSGAKCIQILGNHDIRAIKRLMEKSPEAQEIFKDSLFEYYKFEGVETHLDDRDIVEIGNVSFHHGYLSKLGDHMKTHGKNMVVGHSHTGGVVYSQTNGQTLFELNVGYLADESSEALRYRPTKSSKWTLGYGMIDENGPRFIAL